MLDEKIKVAADMYPFKITDSYRTRGGFVCVTDDGLKLLKEYPYWENHLICEKALKDAVRAGGYKNIDSLLPTADNALWAEDMCGRHFVMRQWYNGRECDVRDKGQILRAVSDMAVLHRAMKDIHIDCEWLKKYRPQSAGHLFSKRSRELKTIMNYVQAKKLKNEFETLYMNYYSVFYNQALKAGIIYEAENSEDVFRRAVEAGSFIHGDYSYHNIIFNGKTTATVNFERSVPGTQMQDLYQFMRKVLEKYHWDIKLGMDMAAAYERELPIDSAQKEYLYILLLYPEKFWKIANHYYNSRKSWTSNQNTEKLKKCIASIDDKNRFLDEFCRII